MACQNSIFDLVKKLASHFVENYIHNIKKKFDSDRIICHRVIPQANFIKTVLKKKAFKNKLTELIELSDYSLEDRKSKII